MSRVINVLLWILLLGVSSISTAQTTSEKLKKEEQRLSQNIAKTKSLLEQTQSNTKTTFNELNLINNQIRYREELLRNYDNQIRGAEVKIGEKEIEIDELNIRIAKLKEQYEKLLIYAYKHRNKYGDMMYVFAADSYHEADKRQKYLEKIKDLQKKQFVIIKQHQELIVKEIEGIKKEKEYKSQVIEQKKEERAEIAKDKEQKEKIYQEFKSKENELANKLKDEERERERLRARIDAAIKKEIAEAEERRRKAAEEARKKAEAEGKSVTEATEVALAETKEVALISQNFEGNRGKLPWPVEKGTITEGFGKNPHPTLDNVYTNNNGIDISAPKNAQVRAVFEGEVTSVLNIPGAGKVVIVKHGNYRTVYSNLQNVYVTKGSKVTTKQVIGSLLTKDGESVSLAHFEIHQVVSGTVKSLNPSLWIAK